MSEAMTFFPDSSQGYPVFTPNQVLASEDLNALVAYFDQQTVLTRSQLIGWGIVRGLSPTVTKDAVTITVGVGLTPTGQMILLPPAQQNGETAKTFRFAAASTLTQDKDTAPTATIFELFEKAAKEETRRPLSELFTLNSNPPSAPAMAIPEATTDRKPQPKIQSFVLVIIRDRQNILRSDSLLSYNAAGQDRRFFLRFFLVPQELVTSSANSPGSDQENELTVPQTLLAPKLYRLGYTPKREDIPEAVRLCDITHRANLTESYRRCCQLGLAELKPAIAGLFEQMAKLSELAELNISPPKLEHWTTSAGEEQSATSDFNSPGQLQYFYAYLGNILAAYGDLSDAVATLVRDTPRSLQPPKLSPPALSFFADLTISNRALGAGAKKASPLNYLLLGSLEPPKPGAETDGRRHGFIFALRDRAVNQQRRKHIEFLIERLRRLCQEGAFEVPSHTEIRVTPGGDRSTSLGQQAIPYYLNYQKLHQYWNYEAYQHGTGDRLPAYFAIDGAGAKPRAVGEHLLRVSPEHSIYRIEGHLGQSCGRVVATLEQYRQDYNLPFEVLCLRLADPSSGAAAPAANEAEGQPSEEGGSDSDAIAAAPLVVESLPQPHDFAQFARCHPGLEPIGGVPRGGTFILVYVETEPGQDSVVADFALPGAIGPMDLVAPPTFTLAFESSSSRHFSEDDNSHYEIAISPQFGLVQGPGITTDSGKFYFQPSSLGGQVNQDQTITLTGRWGRQTRTLTVEVHALPNAQFWLGIQASSPGDQGENEMSVRRAWPPIALKPKTEGGVFVCFRKADPAQQPIDALIQPFPPSFIPENAVSGEVYVLKHTVTAAWDAHENGTVTHSVGVRIVPPGDAPNPVHTDEESRTPAGDVEPAPVPASIQPNSDVDPRGATPVNSPVASQISHPSFELSAALPLNGHIVTAALPQQGHVLPGMNGGAQSTIAPMPGAIAALVNPERPEAELAPPVDHPAPLVVPLPATHPTPQSPIAQPPPSEPRPQTGFLQRWRQSMSRNR